MRKEKSENFILKEIIYESISIIKTVLIEKDIHDKTIVDQLYLIGKSVKDIE
jgi:hypothetical protein